MAAVSLCAVVLGRVGAVGTTRGAPVVRPHKQIAVARCADGVRAEVLLARRAVRYGKRFKANRTPLLLLVPRSRLLRRAAVAIGTRRKPG